MKNIKDTNQERLILKHRGDFDYFLLSRTENSEAVIASLNPDELEQKLSKENCDDIFGVSDIDKLAKELYPYHFGTAERIVYKQGFNKALDLNKDKVFSKGDVAYIINLMSIDDISFENAICKFQSLQQPTEMVVEIEMEIENNDFILHSNYLTYYEAERLFQKKVPKLDSNGCLILKPIK